MKTTLIKTVSRLLNRKGYTLKRNSLRNYYSFHNLLDDLLLNRSEFHFIQIGGCDGKSFDPLYPYIQNYTGKISGVIVEPVFSYAEELKELYKEHEGIEVIQKAIHHQAKRMKFYRPDMNHAHLLPAFAKGIASFDKHHLLKFKIPETCIIEEEADCISFSELLWNRGITDLDLLQIDTEGYDAFIVNEINFSEIKPSVIHFEHGLRDGIMDMALFAQIITKLNRENYDCIVEDYDLTACVRDLL